LLSKKSKVNLNNNTILITGGGSGIGLALAVAFLKCGNKIIISGRNIERLKSAKRNFPELEIIQCDISSEASVRALVQEIRQKYPALNFLVNNAGMMRMWNIRRETINLNEQKEEILSNLFGTIQLTQSLLPFLLAQKNSAVLTVSSALAYVPMSAAPVYSATKAALHSYSVSTRQQLQNTGIKIFELLPGAIETEMSVKMEKSLGIESNKAKVLPEKLALLTLKGLKNDKYEIRPGMANSLYIIHRLFPSLAKKILQKQSDQMLAKL
jgi:uncharacterized oxidoreductase